MASPYDNETDHAIDRALTIGVRFILIALVCITIALGVIGLLAG